MVRLIVLLEGTLLRESYLILSILRYLGREHLLKEFSWGFQQTQAALPACTLSPKPRLPEWGMPFPTWL